MRVLDRILRRRRDLDSIERHHKMVAALNPQRKSARNKPSTAPGADPQEVSNASNKGR